jgi:FKBP-type peptidyl-prolyl cis-trans isomerase FkpA
MKRIILSLLIFCAVAAISGCFKTEEGCVDKTVQSEDAAMQAYASANGITAIKHSSGMYYQVINPGSGTTPTFSSVVFVRYTGKLTSGTVFDSQTNSTATGWQLGGLIPGWQLGIPLIQEGGSIKLIIPSSLAYGCQGRGPIPANSILYFEIDLVDVQ